MLASKLAGLLQDENYLRLAFYVFHYLGFCAIPCPNVVAMFYVINGDFIFVFYVYYLSIELYVNWSSVGDLD